MVELENKNSLCAVFESRSFHTCDYVNPNFLEVSLSSEKEHPDSARISIGIDLCMVVFNIFPRLVITQLATT